MNSTHVKATFRCQVSKYCSSLTSSYLIITRHVSQNCTTWAGGSLGSGDLTSYQVLAYVVGTSSTPANLADAASTIQQHDYFNFLGVDLSAAHDPNYSAYINGTPITVSVPPASSTPASSSSVHSSSVPPSTSSSAPTAVQTQWGQVRVVTVCCSASCLTHGRHSVPAWVTPVLRPAPLALRVWRFRLRTTASAKQYSFRACSVLLSITFVYHSAMPERHRLRGRVRQFGSAKWPPWPRLDDAFLHVATIRARFAAPDSFGCAPLAERISDSSRNCCYAHYQTRSSSS